MPEITEKVTAFIEQFQLLPAAGEIIVAVSGGVDSLCLLHLLHRLCGPEKRYPGVSLHVAHLDHQLRGAEGERDAARVAQLAAAWELPATIGSIDVPALARAEHRSLEDAARAARYRFLRQAAQGSLIAVAHQADDQVETLLLHYLRGGGLRGMVGMTPRQQDIIRPLLALTRAETAAYCREWGLLPLEDASNSDPRFLRNRVRHELLPLLESLNPGIRPMLLRNAEVTRVDLDWIEEQVTWLWPRIVRSEGQEVITLDVDGLWKLPLSLQRHLLRRAAEMLCSGQSPLELRHYRLIEELCQRGASGEERALHLPGQLTVSRRLNLLTIERRATRREQRVFSAAQETVILPIPGRIIVPGTGWLATAGQLGGEDLEQMREALAREDQAALRQLLPSRGHTVYIDSESIGLFLQIRTRKPGDRLQPLGMAQEKKVQDVMVDQHVPRAARARTPLFFSVTHCVWVAGVCIDERVKLTGKTRGIIRLSIEATTESDAR
jgi:tRNA(Ile)-lysidine synthase